MALYVYDNEKNEFREHRLSLRNALKEAARYLGAGLLAAAAIYLLTGLVFQSKEEKALRAENRYLAGHYDAMLEKSRLVDDVIYSLEMRDEGIYNAIFHTDPPAIDAIAGDYDAADGENYFSMDEVGLVEDSQAALQTLLQSFSQIDREIRAIKDKFADQDFQKKYFPSIIPLRNFTIPQTGASTGMRISPFFKTLQSHNGIDLLAPYGTEVVASASGKVVEVLCQTKGLGNMVVIDHGNGIRTVYAHLSEMKVSMYQTVEQGKVIGRVGSSGTSFAAALHYEVLKDGRAMDPVNYFFADLSPALFHEMERLAATTGQSLD